MLRAIDLFAGLGGFTEGATRAGVDVRWAANHWRLAVETHELNHPETEHKCQDLHQANWAKVPACDLVLASPCCQGHSKARGKDRPQHDESRSTAWAVVSCCEYHKPAAFVVENVAEFREWVLYPSWRDAMSRLGYELTEAIIDAADAGVPQHRKRLFVVGSRRSAIEVPQPTAAHQPIAPVINWDYPKWSRLEDKVEATRNRAANGRRLHGERFVMPYYSGGSGRYGRSIDRPLGTVTCVDRWGLVDGERCRMLQPSEYRAAMGFPEHYEIAGTKREQLKLLGNSIPPAMAEHVVRSVVEGLAL